MAQLKTSSILTVATVVLASFLAFASCGTDAPAELGRQLDIEIVPQGNGSGRSSVTEQNVGSTRAIPNEPATADEPDALEPRNVTIISTDTTYTVNDFVNARYFKKSKEYDVEGLRGATAAIYGFYGSDPYDRQEYEIRFYPDHDSALTEGVDFANEATGKHAIIAKDVQRWDEGLTQRRECQGNVRGSHHSGKCDNAKYGDYVIAGNVVVLCQGKDSETSLENCAALMSELQ